MSERARAFWRRHATLLVAALLHAGILWLVLPSMINRAEPPPDAVDVTSVPPMRMPKLNPVHTKPAVRPAKVNSTASRGDLQPAPRLARFIQPPIHLTLPAPLASKPPMALPVPAGPTAHGAPASGTGGNGSGAGNGSGYGSQAGNDYLIRLKAYIDRHKGGDRHREPHDADVVLVLDPDGMLTDIRIVSSSGDPAVDDEIMLQLKQMSPFPKPPPVLFSATKQRLPVADKWVFPRPW